MVLWEYPKNAFIFIEITFMHCFLFLKITLLCNLFNVFNNKFNSFSLFSSLLTIALSRSNNIHQMWTTIQDIIGPGSQKSVCWGTFEFPK